MSVSSMTFYLLPRHNLFFDLYAKKKKRKLPKEQRAKDPLAVIGMILGGTRP